MPRLGLVFPPWPGFAMSGASPGERSSSSSSSESRSSDKTSLEAEKNALVVHIIIYYHCIAYLFGLVYVFAANTRSVLVMKLGSNSRVLHFGFWLSSGYNLWVFIG